MSETSVRAAIASAAAQLAAVSETSRLDAELLMAHALGLSREVLLLSALDTPVAAGFADLLARRLQGEPIAYITGMRDFWTISLSVRPGVLIPRPDSETLIEVAVRHFGGRSPATVLDLGVGSGALLLAALEQWPEATGIGVDRSEEALAVAQANADRLGMAERARMVQGDWAAGIEGPFDLILCNPPYVESGATLAREVAEYEPAGALFAGADGLDEYRLLAPQVGRLIAPGGIALFEIGADQGRAVQAIFAGAGLESTLFSDLGARDRCIAIRP